MSRGFGFILGVLSVLAFFMAPDLVAMVLFVAAFVWLWRRRQVSRMGVRR
ncbi:MAG: hypothetical protein HOQ24_08635 [Mycobacteriaceae bacterium]|nr:hypothetical protein [Mycobacteriaceae bacterium]